jgi:hypothetical protein
VGVSILKDAHTDRQRDWKPIVCHGDVPVLCAANTMLPTTSMKYLVGKAIEIH